MNRALTAIAILFALVLGLVLTLRGEDGPREKRQFAYVDVKKAIDGYRRTMRLEGEISAWREEKDAVILARRARLKELDRAMADAPAGSRVFLDAAREYVKAKHQLNVELELLEHDVQFKLTSATRDVYEDILRCCESLRAKHGFEAIWKVDGGELETDSKTELLMRINTRPILCHDPSLDITSEVIETLNEELKKR